MRWFLTRCRERFVCGCWSPRIHRRLRCSRRWLSRSPRVNIFGQRLSCRSCWCCPRVNGSSWFGTCKKSQQEHKSVQFHFGKLSQEVKLCYEPLLPINTKHKKVKQFSIRNADLRYTCRKTRTTKFCGRWMNNTKFPFETEFKKISSSNMKINTVSLQTLPMTSWYLTQGDLKHRVWYTSECTEGRGKKTCLTTCNFLPISFYSSF